MRLQSFCKFGKFFITDGPLKNSFDFWVKTSKFTTFSQKTYVIMMGSPKIEFRANIDYQNIRVSIVPRLLRNYSER